jgi:hypothetical protein|tara:strand:+ start:928 stop:1707 length:780 start_codon:yes stop_codon:yes gene_type:complete
MSENGNENGTVNKMENETEVQDAIVKLITKVVEEQWGQFVASGFDVETHVKNAIDKVAMELKDEQELTGEKVFEALDGYVDWDDIVSNVIDGSYIEENIDWYDAASRVEDNIDWNDRIRDNIDIYDIASEVRDEIDVSDQIQESIVDWVNNGCSQVDTVAEQLYDRAMRRKGNDTDGDTVVLSRDEYNRIMEVVNFIRPAVEAPVAKTATDIANELVAEVDAQEAMNLVQSAIVAKATADAQALVAAANGESNDGQSSE